MKYLILLLPLTLVACTDADRASMSSLGHPGTVTCYSGGKVIYKGASTGVIQTISQSDGWEFRDAKTLEYVRVSGPCVIINEVDK